MLGVHIHGLLLPGDVRMVGPAQALHGSQGLALRSLHLQLGVALQREGRPSLLSWLQGLAGRHEHAEPGQVPGHLEATSSPGVPRRVRNLLQGTATIDGSGFVHHGELNEVLGHQLDGSHRLVPTCLTWTQTFRRKRGSRLLVLPKDLRHTGVLLHEVPPEPIGAPKELLHVDLLTERGEVHDGLDTVAVRLTPLSSDQVAQQLALADHHLGLVAAVGEPGCDALVEESLQAQQVVEDAGAGLRMSLRHVLA